MPDAVADLLREVLPYSAGVLVPPGWDRPYTECFGFTLEEIYAEARPLVRDASCARPGCRSSRSPARSRTRSTSRPTSARERMIALLQAGLLGERHRRRGARPGDDGAAVRLAAARRRPPHRAGRAR